MREIEIREGEEFIKPGQLLKKADMGFLRRGRKMAIEKGQVLVNGETELRRGRKNFTTEIRLPFPGRL